MSDVNSTGGAGGPKPDLRPVAPAPVTRIDTGQGTGSQGPEGSRSAAETRAAAPVVSLEPVRDERGSDEGAEGLQAAVARLNDYAQSIRRELQFSIDDDTGRPLVRVYDGETQELIRQIPSDLALRLARRIDELGTPELLDARI